MVFEWIIAGALLLGAAAILKKMQEQSAFETLMVAFTCLWCALLAMHLWGIATWGVMHVAGSALDPRRAALIGYWVAFLAAAAPNALIIKACVRGYVTTFPPLADAIIQWAGSLLVAGAFFCLVLMSISIAAASARDFDASRLRFRADLVPLRVYLRVARALPELPDRPPPSRRLPDAARHLVWRSR